MKKNQAINIGFLLSLVFLGALMYWPGYLLHEFMVKDNDEGYVFTLTVQLNDLLKSLKNESNEQRLILSSGKNGIENYRAAVKRVDDNLTRLWDLTKDKPQYRDRLSVIAPLIEKRHALLRGSLENGFRDPGAKQLIHEIRNHVSNLEEQSLKDLRKSSVQEQSSLERIRTLMVTQSLVVALLFTTVFVLLRRDLARRTNEEAMLARDRDKLDDLVARRTEELLKANELLKNEMEVRRKAEFALHSLNRHSAFIREEERRTISRDIHDEIGQSLTALKLDIAWVEHKFVSGNAEFAERLTSMKSFLDRLIGKVQNIISELRPPLLDSLGVADAIHWQVHEFRRRNRITCELSLDEGINEVDMNVATSMIRIIMEALTNISRHAQATKAHVRLKVDDKSILVEISDNGRGVTREEMDSHASYGLMGMQERAALCDGTLTFKSAPGGGTVVSLSIPFARRREAS